MLLLLACDVGSESEIVYTADDDEEIFEDGQGDGIAVSCSGTEGQFTVTMERGFLQSKALGPHFVASFTLHEGDEGRRYPMEEIRFSTLIGYHDGLWPKDKGEVEITDWVGVGEVDRVVLELRGIGDDENHLDGVITCVQ